MEKVQLTAQINKNTMIAINQMNEVYNDFDGVVNYLLGLGILSIEQILTGEVEK